MTELPRRRRVSVEMADIRRKKWKIGVGLHVGVTAMASNKASEALLTSRPGVP